MACEELLDGLAGLWCSLAGHGQKRITDAVTTQMQELDFAPTFQFAHPKDTGGILLEIVAVMHDYRGVGLWRREPIAEVHVEADD